MLISLAVVTLYWHEVRSATILDRAYPRASSEIAPGPLLNGLLFDLTPHTTLLHATSSASIRSRQIKWTPSDEIVLVTFHGTMMLQPVIEALETHHLSYRVLQIRNLLTLKPVLGVVSTPHTLLVDSRSRVRLVAPSVPLPQPR